LQIFDPEHIGAQSREATQALTFDWCVIGMFDASILEKSKF
jgi:hypothetical protein